MADDQNIQRVDMNRKVDEPAQTKDTVIFGERIIHADEIMSANQELLDDNGEMLYREHDEFGEWLDRHN
jgi:hypothetical protein